MKRFFVKLFDLINRKGFYGVACVLFAVLSISFCVKIQQLEGEIREMSKNLDNEIKQLKKIHPVMGLSLNDAELDRAPSDTNGAIAFNGHRYKIIVDTGSWFTALRRCEEMGGHLCTITSGPELEFVQSLVAPNSAYWIGAMNVEGQWRWVTGENFNSEEWGIWVRGSQPDGQERYLGINKKLFDYADASNKWHLICEWDS
jgi:hypothetical protein